MKKIFTMLLILTIISQIVWAAADDPGDIKVKENNILPQTNLVTIFQNTTSGNGEAFGLGDVKMSCHTWTVETDKETDDVSWTMTLQGSLDNSFWATLDNFTSVGDWKRDVTDKGANWVRASVTRNYTSTAPEVTIKYQGGCN